MLVCSRPIPASVFASSRAGVSTSGFAAPATRKPVGMARRSPAKSSPALSEAIIRAIPTESTSPTRVARPS